MLQRLKLYVDKINVLILNNALQCFGFICAFYNFVTNKIEK